ncbi:hypothetical protein Aph01nite_22270 [Acrocarpospora phusangensis]|uniref:Uncharacterized protein n=1 Tax=Acrocarpospora phusangensis TaxID=1070424 RepID=A0A919Q7U3_9ACTN|nr:hypothetical protein [Acrocarpospora phusangensis]GIH23917.1 hypothetical protein Aph01nite_22270 [Acrocarpospora phusangensis]
MTYLPDGWRNSGEIVLFNDGIARTWSHGQAAWVTVEAVYGLRANDLKSLQRISFPTDEQLEDARRTSVNGSPAVEGRVVGTSRGLDKGRMRLWVIRPGLGIRIWASSDFTDDLRRLSESIELISNTLAEPVDGMRAPQGLGKGNERVEFGEGWQRTTRYWGEATGQSPHVAMTVYRGQAVDAGDWQQTGREPWSTDTPTATQERAVVEGVSGFMRTWTDTGRVNGEPRPLQGRRFIWTVETGLAIAITTVVDPTSSTMYASSELEVLVRSVK